MYASWQSKDILSAVRSGAHTVAELRAEGVYRILTPDEAVEYARGAGEAGNLVLHPLCGGMPIDEGWRSLQLLCEQVLPRLGAEPGGVGGGGHPISSNALPLVSGTHLRMNGIESTAKTA